MATEITLFVLLMVASAVAMLAKRLSLPYTVTLVVAGLGLGMLPPHFAWLDLDTVRLTPELLFNIFLPMLLFEAAFHLSWPKFRENLTAILLLAVPGVIVAVGLGGTFAYWLEPLANTSLPLMVALLFASMLAATDPVSVVALFKELGVPKRLAVVMEGESLLNDAVGVVVFLVVSAMLGLGHTEVTVTPLWVARTLVWEVFVGIGIGAGVGLGVSWMTTLVDDHLVEIMLTTIAAFGSYLIATAFHSSAILAVVAAGMACGNVGARYGMTPTNRIAVESFWEYAVFVANGFVFLLLGKEIDVFRMLGHGAEIVIAWVALMVARGVVVLVVERALMRTREKLPPRWSGVLVWGGLRGSLSMVLALSLPLHFAYRELLVDLTFGVVLLSILLQGTTMTGLLRWSGAIGGGSAHVEYLRIRTALRATRAGLKHLDEQLAGGDIHTQTYDTLRGRLGGREAQLEEQLSQLDENLVDAQAAEVTRVERELLEVERQAIREASEAGLVPREALEVLLDDLSRRAHGHDEEGAHATKPAQAAAEVGAAAEAAAAAEDAPG
ncbi:MAG: cation:proton antiporter [Myxococcales bacterium]|nr:cation:proton antiporter [Myxococcales bacterium]MCB9628446.1 cation:proton antiporter [Sandaracinaceae bacterium]